jgi:hypothetical protein
MYSSTVLSAVKEVRPYMLTCRNTILYDFSGLQVWRKLILLLYSTVPVLLKGDLIVPQVYFPVL